MMQAVQPCPLCSRHGYVGQHTAGTRTRRPIAFAEVSGELSGGGGVSAYRQGGQPA
jgi:hypothetical protein